MYPGASSDPDGPSGARSRDLLDRRPPSLKQEPGVRLKEVDTPLPFFRDGCPFRPKRFFLLIAHQSFCNCQRGY